MMADQNDKHPRNVPGRIYNDLSCVDCGLCPEIAPMIFQRDDEGGYSFVTRQPGTRAEADLVREAIEACPTESIGEDG